MEALQAREDLMESIQTFLKKFNQKQHQLDVIQELLRKLLNDVQIISEELANFINTPNWNRPAFCNNDDADDDKEYTIEITPVLPTEEPNNSLSMRDEHLSTIPKTESDELIKSSVENLIPIPSESEDFFNIESECDVPDCDDPQTKFFQCVPILSSTILPLVMTSQVMRSLMERLLYDNSSPRPPEDFHANPNTIIESLPIFPIPVEDSGSPREEIDIFPGLDDSIPPDSTIDEVEDISRSCANIFPPTTPSYGYSTSIPLIMILDPIESTRFLATFSPVIDTLLPFSSENKDKVFNHGVLASKEKSPPSSSHRGFKASKLFHKSPMLIHGENIPILDVLIAPDFEASRARGFVLRSLELHILSFIMGIQYPNLID
ncbi:hypothetical protein Tco_0299950 [Tanacetum coccineum]